MRAWCGRRKADGHEQDYRQELMIAAFQSPRKGLALLMASFLGLYACAEKEGKGKKKTCVVVHLQVS